jgi:hypothetical protein
VSIGSPSRSEMGLEDALGRRHVGMGTESAVPLFSASLASLVMLGSGSEEAIRTEEAIGSV